MGNEQFCPECGASTYKEARVKVDGKEDTFVFIRRCIVCGESHISAI